MRWKTTIHCTSETTSNFTRPQNLCFHDKLFFKRFFLYKYFKIIYIFYFLKFIFYIFFDITIDFNPLFVEGDVLFKNT